jgi:hypothetical protein
VGNQLPNSLSDGGVEPPPATLFNDWASPYAHSSDEDEDEGYVIVDLESGYEENVVEFTPEDKTMRIFGRLRRMYPEPIPIRKEMLYFDMIHSEEEVDDTDIALGIMYGGDASVGEIVTCYWMMNTHAYVDILKYNSQRLGMDPIFESVKAENLHFVCIQKAHVNMCVKLFWDKFIDMELPVYTPDLNGMVVHRENGFEGQSPQISHETRPSLSYCDNELSTDVVTKKDE